jgi:hypothetical protein
LDDIQSTASQAAAGGGVTASQVWAYGRASLTGAGTTGSRVLQSFSDIDSLIGRTTSSNLQSVISSVELDIGKLKGTTIPTTAAGGRPDVHVVSINATPSADIASQVWDAKYTTYSAASSFGSLVSDIYSAIGALDGDLVSTRGSTTSQMGTTSQLRVGIIDHASQFDGQLIKITNGSQQDEVRRIWNTDLTNSRLSVKPAFNAVLASNVGFTILADQTPLREDTGFFAKSGNLASVVDLINVQAANTPSNVWSYPETSAVGVANGIGSALGGFREQGWLHRIQYVRRHRRRWWTNCVSGMVLRSKQRPKCGGRNIYGGVAPSCGVQCDTPGSRRQHGLGI